MNTDELRIFSRVAELASFSRAADQLGLTRARVSVAVQHLEERLGTRLLQRTTRSVRLTEDGERFLDRCKDYLSEGEQLATMFRANTGGLTGRLRIDLPATLARDLVIPRLPEFLARHPALEIGISTTDRRVDLVNEGFDCVLRVGVLGDSELVARPLGFMRMANAASPAYLRDARHAAHAGRPRAAPHRALRADPLAQRRRLGILRRGPGPLPNQAGARHRHGERHRRLQRRGGRGPRPDPGAGRRPPALLRSRLARAGDACIHCAARCRCRWCTSTGASSRRACSP
jgi:DNA-binding transcriptional LysR family regulator